MGLKVAASAIDGTTGGTGKQLSDALVSVGPAGRGGTGRYTHTPHKEKYTVIISNMQVAVIGDRC